MKTYVTMICMLALASLARTAEIDFAFERALTTVTEREELAAVALDRHVHAATRDGYPDLRVRDADGHSVPAILQRHTRLRSVAVETTQPAAEVLSLTPDAAANRLEAIVRPPRQESPAWLEVVTPLHDFEKRVSLYAGESPSGPWQALSLDQSIYDYSRFMDVRRCRIILPETAAAARCYRLVFDEVTDSSASALVELTTRSGAGKTDQETVRKMLQRRDFRIDRIDFGYSTREDRQDAPVQLELPLHSLSTERDANAGWTRVTLAADRLPITALRVAFAERNVSRAVRIEARLDRDEASPAWTTIGQGRLSRIDFRNLREANLTIPVDEVRTDTLRVTISDGDAPPLTLEGITAISPEHRVLFLAQPGVRYTLAYGHRTAPAAAADETVLRRLAASQSREVHTLSLSEAPAEGALTQPAWLRCLNSRAALVVVMAVAVVILALAMVQAARRLGSGAAAAAKDDDGAA